jgi:hypothetical protein
MFSAARLKDARGVVLANGLAAEDAKTSETCTETVRAHACGRNA